VRTGFGGHNYAASTTWRRALMLDATVLVASLLGAERVAL
jgi:hypothetical protein